MIKALYFILFLSLLISTNSKAETLPVVSPDFTYKIQQYSSLKNEIENISKRIDQFFDERELRLIFLPMGFSETRASLSKVDRIYSGDLGNTVVMLKFGVIPSEESIINKPVLLAGGYLEHFSFASGLIVAVFVKTENWDNANEILTNLKLKIIDSIPMNKNLKKVSKSFLEILITSAQADVTGPCDLQLNPTSKSYATLAQTSSAIINESSPIQHVSACALSALKGVWDGSGGFVLEGVKGLSEFLMSPIESGKRFWESSSKMWDGTKKFFNDFEVQARRLYAGFDTLEPIIKTKIACQVIGTIGGAALLTYFTAGTVTAAASELILLKIKNAITAAFDSAKLSNVKKLFSYRISELEEFDLELMSKKNNLFSIPRGTPASSIIENKNVLSKLENLPIEEVSSKRKAGLSKDEIQQIYREISDHPVVAIQNIKKYENNSSGMGYCFGRATATHIKALLKGADKSSIRKIWAIGDLKPPNAEWRYHVATIIRDSRGKWFAIDPFLGNVVPVEKWYAEMKKIDTTGNMRIIDTEAKRYGPQSSDKYSPKELSKKVYEGYYDDLMKSFQQEVRASESR